MATTANTRKTAAKKVAEPVKKAPAKAAGKSIPPAPTGATLRYAATGRSGKVAYRSSTKPFTHAVDLADAAAPREDARKGLVVRFFPSKERADAWAEKMRGEGYDAKTVAARPAS